MSEQDKKDREILNLAGVSSSDKVPEKYLDYKVEKGKELEEGQLALTDKVQIENALKIVEDPDVKVDVFNLGLIYSYEVDKKGNVEIEMTLTSPTCPYGEFLVESSASAVAGLDGVGKVTVILVWDPAWSIDLMSDEARFDLDLL